MGFSNIASFMLLFFALMITVTIMAIFQTNLVETASLTFNEQERINQEMNTRIDILNITFDNQTVPDTTTLYVKNSGSTKLQLDYVEVFIDEKKLPRKPLNRSISFAAGSDVINPLHWDPDEIIIIDAYMNLDNVSHIATVTTDLGVKDQGVYLG